MPSGLPFARLLEEREHLHSVIIVLSKEMG